MGEYITMSDAFTVTIFSMAAVFIVLIMISFLINGLKIAGNIDKRKEKDEKRELKGKPELKKEAMAHSDIEDVLEEELVAVIAAAIAANLGLNIPDIRIKGIKRIPQNLSPWIVSGRKS